MNFGIKKYLILLLAMYYSLSIAANQKDSVVYKIDIKQNINSSSWIFTKQGFEQAKEKKASCILIHMNTYGGEVVYADSIRTKILNTDIPVYVFIDNNAASAGALISIACDKIYMRPGATIGAATVVDQSGSAMPDKYQSYMRGTMRATAEFHGKDTVINGNDTTYKWRRDPLIAEAMVDSRTIVPGLIDSTRTLTFTAEEAIKYGYCDGIATSPEKVAEDHLEYKNYRIEQYQPTLYDKLKGFLTNSILQSLLIMFIIGAIYFELQTPGVGFPLIVAITAAILYFAPLYIDGLAANWEILLFVIGLILIVLEIFVIPGFGIAGISGIVLTVAGLTLSLIENVAFDFQPVNGENIGKAMLTVIIGFTLGVGLIIYISSRIGHKGLFRKIALEKSLDTEKGYVGVSVEEKKLIGLTGTTVTILRPAGKVKIEQKYYDAISEGKYIEQGCSVIVTRYETGQIYVKETE